MFTLLFESTWRINFRWRSNNTMFPWSRYNRWFQGQIKYMSDDGSNLSGTFLENPIRKWIRAKRCASDRRKRSIDFIHGEVLIRMLTNRLNEILNYLSIILWIRGNIGKNWFMALQSSKGRPKLDKSCSLQWLLLVLTAFQRSLVLWEFMADNDRERPSAINRPTLIDSITFGYSLQQTKNQPKWS